MLVTDFDFALPPASIAQQPPAVRGTSRMLQMDRASGEWRDSTFSALPEFLVPGDLLVLNDTRVLPCRFFARRRGTKVSAEEAASAPASFGPAPTGAIEVLLTEWLDEEVAAPGSGPVWRALVKPAKKVPLSEELVFSDGAEGIPMLTAEVIGLGDFGERTLRFAPVQDFLGVLERIGTVPLPPYIHRERGSSSTPEDRDRYQTVYAAGDKQRSAAAPTAGLHFTPAILEGLHRRGVEVAYLTLHVGLGTFQPVRTERTEQIRLHAEPYVLPSATAAALNRAWSSGRRIVAVGTTTTRTLEHVTRRFIAENGALGATNPLRLEEHAGKTSLFLSPGPDGDGSFQLVTGLLTNFHLPQSTLLMLVSAFAGRERVLAAYRHAVTAGYRFFSYGDCMLLL